MAQLLNNRHELARFEALLLTASLLSQAWVSGLLRAGLSTLAPKKPGLLTYAILAAFALLALLSLELLEPWIAQQFDRNYLFASPQEKWWFRLWFFGLTTGFLLDYLWLHQRNFQALWRRSTLLHLAYPLAALLPFAFQTTVSLSQIFQNLAIITLFRSLWALSIALNKHRSNFKFQESKKLLSLAWPLIFLSFMGGYGLHIDGTIVLGFGGPLAFLIFQYGAREFPLSQLLAGGFSESQALNYKKSGQYNNWHSSQKSMLLLSFGPSILLMWSAPSLFERIFGSDFIGSAEVFRLYLLLVIPRMLFPQTLLLAHGKNRALLLIGVIEWLINIGLSLWWVQSFGMIGVAWATVVAFAIEKILLMAYTFHVQLPDLELCLPNRSFYLGALSLMLSYAATQIWAW